MLGEIFKKHGAEISQLNSAPDVNKLKLASVYIIADPDTEVTAFTNRFKIPMMESRPL